jgi:hypothetical protein
MIHHPQSPIHWRGRQEGPLPIGTIEDKLARGEIGLLHEVYASGQWIPLRDFLDRREAAREAARIAKEQEEQRRCDEELRQREEEQRRQEQLVQETAGREVERRQSEREAHTTNCPTCGRDVSRAAKTCPQCGHPFIVEVKHSVFYYVVAVIGSLLVIGTILEVLRWLLVTATQ